MFGPPRLCLSVRSLAMLASLRLQSSGDLVHGFYLRALTNETDPKLIRRALHESEETRQDPNTSDRKERFYLSGV